VNLDKIRAERDTKIARLLRYFGVIMAIFYFVMGLAFMLLPIFNTLDSTTRYVVSTMLIVYGSFRLYRIVKAFKTPTSPVTEEDDDE